MKPTSTPQWYAVYTKPKWEKKVAELLTRRHIHNYCPLNRILKQWHDRKKWVEEPLFTSYVFVCITADQAAEVRKTPGVLNFVYWLGKPAVVHTEEILTIKEFLGEYWNIQLERTPIKVADRVKIVSGPLTQQDGTVMEVRNKTVKVLIPSLGYALVATFDRQHVEVLAPVEQKPKIIRA